MHQCGTLHWNLKANDMQSLSPATNTHTHFVITYCPPQLPTTHYSLMQHYHTLAWTSVSRLCQTIKKLVVQSPAPANPAHECVFKRVQQLVILCCSYCEFEQFAEPFACIKTKFSGRALRLHFDVSLVCFDVRSS